LDHAKKVAVGLPDITGKKDYQIRGDRLLREKRGHMKGQGREVGVKKRRSDGREKESHLPRDESAWERPGKNKKRKGRELLGAERESGSEGVQEEREERGGGERPARIRRERGAVLRTVENTSER